MNMTKQLLTCALLTLSIMSTAANADIRLVGNDIQPDSPSILAYGLMPLNFQTAGEFSLSKNSHITKLSIPLTGVGSVLLSIYSKNQQTNLPEDLIYEMVMDIDNQTYGSLTTMDNLTILLGKGSYWFVMESVNIIEEIFSNHSSFIEPLNSYMVDTNHSGQWQTTRNDYFFLTMDGHPTGKLINFNCIKANNSKSANCF